MTHDSAVRTVVNLLPEIEKSGAEAALADFAREQDLPPAQLEKLAQVFNTLRTVSHIDNAEEPERGATVSLVSVPELVAGYATGLDQEKQATGPDSINSHDVQTIDLNALLHSEIFGMDKAAAETTADLEDIDEAERLVTSFADFNDALIDLEVDLDDAMAKTAAEILTSAPEVEKRVRDISEFEKEALYLGFEDHVKAAGDYMEKFANEYRIKIVRHDYEEAPIERAYDIEHLGGKKLSELAKAAGELSELKKLAASSLEETERALAMEFPADEEGRRPSENNPPEDPTADGGVDPLNELQEEMGEGEAQVEDSKKSTPSTDNKENPKTQSKTDSSKSNKNKGGGGIDGVGVIAAPLKAIGDGIQGAANSFNEQLNKITTRERFNKAQRDTDIGVEDIKRAMKVRRLIAGDQVLREHDPREVLEVYNAIAERNPEIASDPAALRLILREAISYEGLTLDAQKQLSDIRKNTASAESAEKENEKKRYSAGGALPVGTSKK